MVSAPERLLLQPGEVGAAGHGEVEQRVELVAAERRALGRALHLDELAVAGARRRSCRSRRGRPPRSTRSRRGSPSTMPTLTAETERDQRFAPGQRALGAQPGQASASAT